MSARDISIGGTPSRTASFRASDVKEPVVMMMPLSALPIMALGGASLIVPAERNALMFEQRGGLLRNILTRGVPTLAADYAARVLLTTAKVNLQLTNAHGMMVRYAGHEDYKGAATFVPAPDQPRPQAEDGARITRGRLKVAVTPIARGDNDVMASWMTSRVRARAASSPRYTST